MEPQPVVLLADNEPLSPFADQNPKLAQSTFERHKSKWCAGICFFAIIGLVLIIAIPLSISNPEDFDLSENLDEDKLFHHLEQFQYFSTSSEGQATRSAGSVGFELSANYVLEQLTKDTKCQIEIQYFPIPLWAEAAAPQLSQTAPTFVELQEGVDFRTMRFGGNLTGTAAGVLWTPANDGCQLEDYSNHPQNSWALLSPLTSTPCPILDRALLAQANGGVAALFYVTNQVPGTPLPNPRIRVVEWQPDSPMVQIPSLVVSKAAGERWQAEMAIAPVQVTVTTATSLAVGETRNIICDEKNGDKKESALVVGAHLDSVPAGPGINDNGSGAATLLQICLDWFKHRSDIAAKNQVRFIWWGAEELGLLGSRYYVNDLQQRAPEKWARIAANLNFDMLASPNAIPGIVSGLSLPTNASQVGGQAITNLFANSRPFAELQKYFASTSPAAPSPNRITPAYYALNASMWSSDYIPFAAAGVPAGGLGSGANGLKTEDERVWYGGLVGVQYDPCYHLACDTIENVNRDVLLANARAAAFVLLELAQQKDLVRFLSSEK